MLWPTNFILSKPLRLRIIYVKVQYKGYRVKVKVTRAKWSNEHNWMHTLAGGLTLTEKGSLVRNSQMKTLVIRQYAGV